MATKTITVTAERGGERLDVVVTDALDGWSRARVQKSIKAGAVLVDGDPLRRPSATVAAGAAVTVDLDDGREASTDVRGSRIRTLRVLYEDDALAVIDKPAGLVTHPNARQIAGTLSDLAVERFGALPAVQGEDRPGIVHRLDRLTSGVLVIGRSEHVLRSLKAQFKARTVEKTYLAIVHGSPRFDSEWLTGAIEPSPRHPDRMRIAPEESVSERARIAETFIERREDLGPATLVSAKPKTGRTHQIRVHLQAAGLPIVGDRVYGPQGALKEPLPRSVHAMERPALHARELAFDHPETGERVRFEAELPEDMLRLLASLRADH